MVDERTFCSRVGERGFTLEDRRAAERFCAADDQAWVGWWEGRLYRKSPAVLIDIGQGGAKLFAEFAPPSRATVWICIDGPNRTEWVEGTVVEMVRLTDGAASVHLAFRDACPAAFFEVALRGHHDAP